MSDYLFIEVESDNSAKPDMLRVRFLSGSVTPFSVAFLVEGFKLVSQTSKRAVHIQKLDDAGEPSRSLVFASFAGTVFSGQVQADEPRLASSNTSRPAAAPVHPVGYWARRAGTRHTWLIKPGPRPAGAEEYPLTPGDA